MAFVKRSPSGSAATTVTPSSSSARTSPACWACTRSRSGGRRSVQYQRPSGSTSACASSSPASARTAPSSSPGRRTRTRPIGTATVIAVSGELDVATVPRLRAALTEAAERGSTRLVVDLSEVTFVDSVSVGAILHAQRRLGLEGRLAVVLAPSSYARVIFDVVGADAVLHGLQTRPQPLSRA